MIVAVLEYEPGGVEPVIEDMKQRVVAWAETAVPDEAKDCGVVDSAVAVEVLAVLLQAVGFHWAMVLPLREEDTPYSDSPATMLPPLVSLIVSEVTSVRVLL